MEINFVRKDNEEDFYILTNDKGEYHISFYDFHKLGKTKAIKLAENEIELKSKLKHYQNKTINFDQARQLGFCKYGIKDFCKRLNLSLDDDHTISDIYEKLDIPTFIKYPSECVKLFTNDVYNKFGGITNLLNENRSRRILNLVIYSGEVNDTILHTLAYKSALRVINNYEEVYPNDDRPRKAIEAKKLFIEGKINEDGLKLAKSAAKSAARSAARSAAYSAENSATYLAARSAANSAARSAAYSAENSAAYSAENSAARSAENSAAYSAAYLAAKSAALNFQIDTLIELIEGEK